jgi:hypothetical protein
MELLVAVPEIELKSQSDRKGKLAEESMAKRFEDTCFTY